MNTRAGLYEKLNDKCLYENRDAILEKGRMTLTTQEVQSVDTEKKAMEGLVTAHRLLQSCHPRRT